MQIAKTVKRENRVLLTLLTEVLFIHPSSLVKGEYLCIYHSSFLVIYADETKTDDIFANKIGKETHQAV
jgi:hypothetical protein